MVDVRWYAVWTARIFYIAGVVFTIFLAWITLPQLLWMAPEEAMSLPVLVKGNYDE